MDLAEGLNTEFKREYTEDAKRAIIAFANTNGGVLYIGINDDGSVAGVPNPDDTLLQISSAVRNAIKPDLTLFVSYERETFKGHTVIKVNVQKGTASPYYLAGKGIRPEGVYVRQGASTAPATETAILKMIKETDGEKFEDVRSLNQELTFEEAAEEFKEKDCEFGPKQMISLKLQNTAGIYTNLGFLLSDQCVHTIKLAIFEGEEKEIFRDRREFSGSLFRQLNETYKFIDMYNRNHGEISGLYRIDRRDYPEEALREVLTNALVHRDYAYSSSILVSIFESRIEFVTVGGLMRGISLDDIMLGVSAARNENLANVFYRLKLIEAYGTGIPKIMRSYADFPRKPKLEISSNAFKITLPNRNYESVSQFFVSDASQDGGANGLSESERIIMAIIKDKSIISRKDVEAALGVSQAMAVRILRKMLDKGEIHALGGGKNTRYEEKPDIYSRLY